MFYCSHFSYSFYVSFCSPQVRQLPREPFGDHWVGIFFQGNDLCGTQPPAPYQGTENTDTVIDT